MKKVLEGIKVLDFSHFAAGPICAQVLADMGAEVIRVEKPGGYLDRELGPYTPEGQGFYPAYTCRNKKGITLNLSKERGQEIRKELVRQSDIVVESFGPVVNKRVGLDYQSLQDIKEDIIVVSISGYGQSGPHANRVAFDGIAQAVSGMMWTTGFPEGGMPVKTGPPMIDLASGVHGALGAVLALYYREKTGKGQLVDLALLDVAVFFMESIFGEYKVGEYTRPQFGNAGALSFPYNAYKAKDGWVLIGAASPSTWKNVCKAVEREELVTDPRFATNYERVKPESRRYLDDLLRKWVAERTVGEVETRCSETGVPCGPVNTIPEAFSHPQIRAREMIVELDHPGIGKVPLTGIPVKLSKTPGEINTPAPGVGEHNEEVYSNFLGLGPEQLSQLKKEGII